MTAAAHHSPACWICRLPMVVGLGAVGIMATTLAVQAVQITDLSGQVRALREEQQQAVYDRASIQYIRESVDELKAELRELRKAGR